MCLFVLIALGGGEFHAHLFLLLTPTSNAYIYISVFIDRIWNQVLFCSYKNVQILPFPCLSSKMMSEYEWEISPHSRGEDGGIGDSDALNVLFPA